jgi:hypothetical protein
MGSRDRRLERFLLGMDRRNRTTGAKRIKMALKILLLMMLVGSIAAGPHFERLFASRGRKTG